MDPSLDRGDRYLAEEPSTGASHRIHFPQSKLYLLNLTHSPNSNPSIHRSIFAGIEIQFGDDIAIAVRGHHIVAEEGPFLGQIRSIHNGHIGLWGSAHVRPIRRRELRSS